MAIELVQGDTKPTLEIICLDDNDVVIDLSDATNVEFVFKKCDATEYTLKRTCTITEPTEGKVEFDWDEGDLDEVGDYEGEVEIKFDDDKEQTSARLYFRIRAQLG